MARQVFVWPPTDAIVPKDQEVEIKNLFKSVKFVWAISFHFSISASYLPVCRTKIIKSSSQGYLRFEGKQRNKHLDRDFLQISSILFFVVAGRDARLLIIWKSSDVLAAGSNCC